MTAARLRPRRARGGMTLIEVLLAVAIITVLAVIGWSSIDGALEMNDALSANDATTRAARAALGRIRRELQLAYLTDPNRNRDTYQTVFVGQDGNPDTLWFASLAHQRLYRNSRECDQTEITLWVDDGPRGHDAEELPFKDKGDILFHREAERIDQEPSEDGRIWPLAYGVETFNLRYLDGRTGEWMDEWDTRGTDTANRLPRAVQVGLVLLAGDPDGDDDDTIEVPYLTTVLLEYADPITPFNGDPPPPPPPE